jgi:phage terminase large subunit-like protein
MAKINDKLKIGRKTPTYSFNLPYIQSHEPNLTAFLSTLKFPKFYEWQRLLAKNITAIDDIGRFVHIKYGLALSRRNGKNHLLAGILLYYLFVLNLNVLHTAHQEQSSRMMYDWLVDIIEKNEQLLSEVKHREKARGSQRIKLKPGALLKFRTRTRVGGLGEGYDVLIIDEAQEYKDDQESALKYTLSQSSSPQTIMIGTPPTSYSAGTVFKNLRESVIKKQSFFTGWSEWSVKKLTNPYDKNAWYETNPALNLHLSEQTITSEIGNDKLDFNIQRLGYFVKWTENSYFKPSDWDKLKINEKQKPTLKGRYSIGIKYNKELNRVSIAVASKIKDSECIFVEIIENTTTRTDNTFIVKWISERLNKIHHIIIDGRGEQQTLQADMIKEHIPTSRIILPTVKQVAMANTDFEQGVFNMRVKHNNKPELRQAILNADKRQIGSLGMQGYRSTIEQVDISLVDATALAYWDCYRTKEIKPATITW